MPQSWDRLLWPKILQCDQSAVSRIENSKQALTIEQLSTLSSHFNLSVDSILSGKINYWKISEQFGHTLPLKSKYLVKKVSYVREIMPLLIYLNRKKGPQVCWETLEQFNATPPTLFRPE